MDFTWYFCIKNCGNGSVSKVAVHFAAVDIVLYIPIVARIQLQNVEIGAPNVFIIFAFVVSLYN